MFQALTSVLSWFEFEQEVRKAIHARRARFRRHALASSLKSDRESLREDWQNVGEYLKKAMGRYDESKQK